jgi:probable rRNA maturation factor
LITFFSEETSFKLQDEPLVINWLDKIVIHYKKPVNYINYIFCNDIYLLKLSKKYLSHDTYTDIITFQYNQPLKPIESDIFISVDRVEENAQIYRVESKDELLRVLVHGLLHLVGYNDKTYEQRKTMRALENDWISLFKK